MTRSYRNRPWSAPIVPRPGTRHSSLANLSLQRPPGSAVRHTYTAHGPQRAALVAALLSLVACDRGVESPEFQRTEGSPDRGIVAMQHYSCASCHRIPGIVGATSWVGPPLSGIAKRKYIAGFLPNTPENMLRWLQDPLELAPRSAMPDLNVTEQDARDIAAYLYRLN